ncbi:hypothetical protein K501DRAFT_330994 [Backusella circina FSU 941]|nr:hypothetical protein K501DRAFT_330994 [Backusella circina FSU 941]
MSDVKGIGTVGSVALLVSSMTGPGLSTIPPLFQQSGWLAPVVIFIVVAFLSGCSSLFVCEALSSIRGNEKFQAKVELTTIAQVYLGRKYHYFFQVMLFLALQAVNVSSIILAAQTFDSMMITIFKGTCGLGVSPGGWFCTTVPTTEGNSPFSADDYYIFTFGFLLAAAIVIPLGFFTLVDNIGVQIISFVVLIAILIQWMVAFGQEGLKSELLPATGSNSTMVLGIVIFNYSFITTVPSWVNSLKPDVNIHKCMWISVIISTVFYILLGILGAMAFPMSPSSDILAILSANGSTASLVTCYLFPVCALVTSIPVFTIVIRSNLLRDPYKQKTILVVSKTGVAYFSNRRYEASVELAPDTYNPPINQIKSPIFDHPSIISPDDNDVRMYNPEDNYSISIRRSSIMHSRASRMEHSVTSTPYMNTNQLSVPNTPQINSNGIPIITHSSVVTDHNNNSSFLRAPTSPDINALNIPRGEKTSQNNGSNPAKGLGISNTPSNTTSERLTPRSTAKDTANTSLAGSNLIDSKYLAQSPDFNKRDNKQSPEMKQVRSPIMASIISFQSSVAPAEPQQQKDVDTKIEMHENVNDSSLHRFIAFKTRKYLNPFHLAILSCGALTLAIVFMIIYDLTMLGLGNDVFG